MSDMDIDRHLRAKIADLTSECQGLRADFECEWTPTEKDNKLHELALRYHAETEAYDRTVCTGPIVDGSIQPYGGRQTVLINQNARQVFLRIEAEAAPHGISKAELWRAIGRHA